MELMRKIACRICSEANKWDSMKRVVQNSIHVKRPMRTMFYLSWSRPMGELDRIAMGYSNKNKAQDGGYKWMRKNNRESNG